MTPLVLYTRAKLEKIREAINYEDWFTAIVLSATELERFGCEAIQDYLINKSVGRKLAETIIKPMYLTNVVDCLIVMGVISEKERSKILEINEQRNNFIHRQRKAKFPYGKEARDKYEPLAKEAIRILKEKLNVVKGFVSR